MNLCSKFDTVMQKAALAILLQKYNSTPGFLFLNSNAVTNERKKYPVIKRNVLFVCKLDLLPI